MTETTTMAPDIGGEIVYDRRLDAAYCDGGLRRMEILGGTARLVFCRERLREDGGSEWCAEEVIYIPVPLLPALVLLVQAAQAHDALTRPRPPAARMH